MRRTDVEIEARRSFRRGEAAKVVVQDSRRGPELWIGSDQKAGYCHLTAAQARRLYDELRARLGLDA
jgi:hypothetical protein